MLRSGKNTTALIEAVRNRHFLMADALLMSGYRIDTANSNGDNVLHAICQSAGDIAYDIKRTEERIADFSERWYSERIDGKFMKTWKVCEKQTSYVFSPQNVF